ncbi:MAG: hypothetical protein ABT940_14115, partial [Alphaproteobacteria bacterium]
MTAPNQFNQDQLNTLKGFISAANAAKNRGDLDGVKAALTQYYATQVDWGRGYPKLALGVITNTGFEGQVAIDVLKDIGGSGVTAATQAELMVSLASRDNDIMQKGGGVWPVQAQIENYHYEGYDDLHLPVTAWGGAAFAYFGERWDGGTLTAAERGDGSHGSLYQGMTRQQVSDNLTTLTVDGALKVATAAAAELTVAYARDRSGDASYSPEYLENIIANNLPSSSAIIAGASTWFDFIKTAEPSYIPPSNSDTPLPEIDLLNIGNGPGSHSAADLLLTLNAAFGGNQQPAPDTVTFTPNTTQPGDLFGGSTLSEYMAPPVISYSVPDLPPITPPAPWTPPADTESWSYNPLVVTPPPPAPVVNLDAILNNIQQSTYVPTQAPRCFAGATP